jgi:hypothetical protein
MHQNVFCWRLRLLKGPFVLPCKQGAKGESVFALTMPKKLNYPFDWMVLKHNSQGMLIHMGTQ